MNRQVVMILVRMMKAYHTISVAYAQRRTVPADVALGLDDAHAQLEFLLQKEETAAPEVPPTHKLVPLVPLEIQWGGLARDIIMWQDLFEGSAKTPENLFWHLNKLGTPIPQWLLDEPEMKNLKSVPSKGTRAVIIYRAMVEAL